MLEDETLTPAQVGEHFYRPVVRRNLGIAVSLDITLLAPNGLARVGDTDNRAKALIDALTLPGVQQTAPEDSTTAEHPTFCLMDDDSLVTALSVSSRSWYGQAPGAQDTLALVTVEVVTDGRITITGLGLIG